MHVVRPHAVSNLRLAAEPLPIAAPATSLVGSPRSGSAAICTGGLRLVSARRPGGARRHRGLLRAVLLDGDHGGGSTVCARDVQHAEAALGE